MDDARRRRRAAKVPAARIVLLALAAFLVSMSLVAPVARAPPPIPMTTEGNAYDASGSPLPNGTLIRTFVDGVDYSNDPSVFNAQGGFSVLTNGRLMLNQTTPEPSPVKTGASAGELVVYAAGPLAAQMDFFQELVPWQTDLTVNQDLHLGSPQSTPEPLRIQGVVTQPARGGPQSVFLCNPTASSISLADYYLQVDGPGTFYGGNFTLTGTVAADGEAQVNLTSPFSLIPTGDALKLVYRNPGGPGASAGGQDIVIDRLEFNAEAGGTLDWQPGNTTMGNAPAPGPGQILERSPFCSAAPAPASFQLAPEPGLPPTAPPTVVITAPTPGQNVQGGRAFTIQWTLSDPVFVASYLKVWVNVSYLGSTRTLLAGDAGATTVDWNVPDVSAEGATVLVTAVNPFGSEGNATTRFNILPSTPYSAYIAILVIAVIAVFIVLGFYYARRREAPSPERRPGSGPPPTEPETQPAAAPPPPAAAAAATKVCPACGTVVKEADQSCFFCGHFFGPARP